MIVKVTRISVIPFIVCLFVATAFLSCSNKTATITASPIAATPASTPVIPAFTIVKADVPTETVTFPSEDGILITADVYLPYPKTAPFILLCHRAEWSRGEYRQIAPKLAELGFNSMAIDQRSGKTFNGIDNATRIAADKAKKPTSYTDAIQDIQAGLDYAKTNYAQGTCIIWGSSYSAALALHIAKTNAGKVDGLVAFSPGEYFAEMGKPEPWVAEQAASVNIPVFFTSMATEESATTPIFNRIPSTVKTYYLPSSGGKHGSEALFPTADTSYWVWKSLSQFLSPLAARR